MPITDAEARQLADSLLQDVAAGSLEDLLCNHARDFIDRVQDRARKDAKFRKCLCEVWGLVFDIANNTNSRAEIRLEAPRQERCARAKAQLL
jgi:hypothetical protein